MGCETGNVSIVGIGAAWKGCRGLVDSCLIAVGKGLTITGLGGKAATGAEKLLANSRLMAKISFDEVANKMGADGRLSTGCFIVSRLDN